MVVLDAGGFRHHRVIFGYEKVMVWFRYRPSRAILMVGVRNRNQTVRLCHDGASIWCSQHTRAHQMGERRQEMQRRLIFDLTLQFILLFYITLTESVSLLLTVAAVVLLSTGLKLWVWSRTEESDI